MAANSTSRAHDYKKLYHTCTFLPNQCGSIITHKIQAPLFIVWSIIRKFDDPKAYKPFVRSSVLCSGDGVSVGSLREVRLITGLPLTSSLERLDRVDDEFHVMECTTIGGDRKLLNYHSTITLHKDEDDGSTVVMESYVVDSCEKDMCVFVETMIGLNLRSLAKVKEKMARERKCRCCNKRVGILGFKCKCGGVFCSVHRLPEMHPCSFDFKRVGKIAIQKQNPVIKRDKIVDRI